jgi:uncharacterized protein YoxC
MYKKMRAIVLLILLIFISLIIGTLKRLIKIKNNKKDLEQMNSFIVGLKNRQTNLTHKVSSLTNLAEHQNTSFFLLESKIYSLFHNLFVDKKSEKQ